jgi:hypothetical protein
MEEVHAKDEARKCLRNALEGQSTDELDGSTKEGMKK